MKRLFEDIEQVTVDSFMHELLMNACPTTEEYSPIFDKDIKTYVIELHCVEYEVNAFYENEQFTIVSVRKTFP